jgi:hypothetical protein
LNTGQTTVLQGKEEQPMAKSGGTSPKAHRPPMRKEAESPYRKRNSSHLVRGHSHRSGDGWIFPTAYTKKVAIQKKSVSLHCQQVRKADF